MLGKRAVVFFCQKSILQFLRARANGDVRKCFLFQNVANARHGYTVVHVRETCFSQCSGIFFHLKYGKIRIMYQTPLDQCLGKVDSKKAVVAPEIREWGKSDAKK